MSRGEDVDISGKIARLEEIAETLEDGDIELERAKELREEADQHLEILHDALDVGDGDLIEVADGDPTDDT
jgi:exodeoxyribonuclease VII small subunit